MDQEKNIQDILRRLGQLEKKPGLPDHRHTGFDVSRIFSTDLLGRKIYVPHTVVGTAAATAANYGAFWIAPFDCYVSSFLEVHQTAGTDGGNVTLTLEKLTSTVAPDSGSVMLNTTISLKAAVNIVQTGTLTTTITSLNLAQGDRLCLKDAGTLTSVANVTTLTEITII